MKKAVILLSGGLDSSTVMAMAKDMGYDLYGLTIIYGQRHVKEIDSARIVSKSLGAREHRIMELPDGLFSGSALTFDSEVPMDTDIGKSSEIPSTYVPARNLVFLSMAVSWAEALNADAVFIGVTAVDYSGYPDCRPEFIESFRKTSQLATRKGVTGQPIEIVTPIIDMNKSQIIIKAAELEFDLGLTWSCYSGGEKACGRCETCLYRLKGFKEAGSEDPLEYEV